MASGSFRFDAFRLDPADRQLTRNGAPVELNARYLDALMLLVRERGQLVTKDHFLAEVWRGVPVTDEALTQCIATLRRQLGDSAAQPRFIETVPKHGYRFIAALTADGEADVPPAAAPPWRELFAKAGAGTAGAAAAGILGGLFYGFAGAAQPGVGAISVMLVLACLTLVVALLGGAGVALGLAAAELIGHRRCYALVLGGSVGGLVVGGVVKLIGVDAFNLLFGRSPGDITGAVEGALLGGAIGFGACLGHRGRRTPSTARAMLTTAVTAGAAGMLIARLGGPLLGGSLDLLARSFPGSRLRLDQIGALFGESGFGPVSRMVTGGIEGALFGACLVGAMVAARRRIGRGAPTP
ncbi:MAG: transcriptional regulator [Candidatus Accumulibacter sp.]|nr:transcriptional regulator [Accumulibacter sp.]